MLHVKDIPRSLRFYHLLGFELSDFEGPRDCPGWARISAAADQSAIMFLKAEDDHAVDPAQQGVMLAMYTNDLPGLRAHLVANGVPAPPITYPDYMPSGQITLPDPDGYIVGINHWGKKENDDWERRLAEKRAAGLLP